jgi:predicted phage terminase large subunit-like protein
MARLQCSSGRLVNRLRRLEQHFAALSRITRTSHPQVCPIAQIDAWARHHLDAYFTLPCSLFHQWLAGQLQNLHTRRGTRLALVAPRGSAKSTWVSLAYPVWAAVHGYEPYILLLSDTQSQARLLLEAIKRELEDNPVLAAAYPTAVGQGSPWGQDRIRLANGVAIEALGTGAKIRGRRNRADRPSLIVVDDPENDGHVTSTVQRERSWSWFNRAVANAGTMQTNILVLGTALHRDCLVLRLTRTAGWQGRTFRAIEQWPQRMELWQEWQGIYQDYEDPDHEAKALAFYEQNQPAMTAGARVLWPEQESLYALMCLRATIGNAPFASEKQGDPVNPEQCEWDATYFDYPGFWFEKWPEGLEIKTLGLDPSKGKDAKSGDYSAFIRLGRDARGYLYCEADLQYRPTPQIVADGVEHVRLFKPEGFAIETNQFQELLCAEFQRAGLHERVHLPMYGLNNMTNKQVRIRRLGPYLAQRKLRFKSRSPATALLIQQMKDFPVGDHDDGPDALEMALRLMIELWNGRFQEPRVQRLIP